MVYVDFSVNRSRGLEATRESDGYFHEKTVQNDGQFAESPELINPVKFVINNREITVIFKPFSGQ